MPDQCCRRPELLLAQPLRRACAQVLFIQQVVTHAPRPHQDDYHKALLTPP
jgi:hypothetical protein